MSEVEALRELFSLTPTAVFSRRSDPIPGDLRIIWRLSVLCVVLHRFRSNRSTMENLHTMWWAIRSAETKELFLRWLDGDKRPDEIIVRFDPSLVVTVDLAIGSQLARRTSTGSIDLTPAGLALAADLWSDKEVLAKEKAFISRLPKSLNQRVLKELTEWY